MIKIGIIGGSGLDNPDILKETKEIEVNTPYGQPSSSLKMGKISEVEVVLLARHGRNHTIMPSNVNNQANIWALKQQGCTHILASTACGSLKEEIKPGDLVFIDQFIDRTTKRKSTFYENKQVCHIPMAEPFCTKLRYLLAETAQELKYPYHKKGTVITIEGPRFSTKAESKMFQSWGAEVINMSTVPEVVLAREAGICYASVAMSTDYDCWKNNEKTVNIEEVFRIFKQNAERVIQLFLKTIPKINYEECKCNEDIKTAVINHKEKNNVQERIKSKIRTIPHWPKPGVMFRDITTLLKDPETFSLVIQQFIERYQNQPIDKVLGIESRGFILGSVLAYQLKLPFILARKPGKLPAEKTRLNYQTEYSTDALEIHNDAIQKGDQVLIIDDLLATGGTAWATAQLVEKLGGKVKEIAFVIDLPELKGKEKLKEYRLFNLVEFEGE